MRTAMRKGQAVGHGLGHPGVQPPVGPRSLHPFGVAVRDRSAYGHRCVAPMRPVIVRLSGLTLMADERALLVGEGP
jgi:hypothetical protein